MSGKGARFLRVHTVQSHQDDYGWKSTTWFRARTMPKELLTEAPQDVHRSLIYQ